MAKPVILKDLMYKLGVKAYRFESEIKASNGAVSKILDSDKDISHNLIEKILKRYPDVSREWLETGEGEMFVNNNLSLEPETEYRVRSGKPKEVIPFGKQAHLRITADQYAEAFGDWKGLPMYNTPITASFIETYRDENTYTPQYYLHDPRFRDCDFGAVVTGDSMHSEIRHGDFVACKEIVDKRFIVYGDIYYIVSSNGLETCKYINSDPGNPDNLMLVARNEKISPSPIPKGMIIRLYKVRGIVRGY